MQAVDTSLCTWPGRRMQPTAMRLASVWTDPDQAQPQAPAHLSCSCHGKQPMLISGRNALHLVTARILEGDVRAQLPALCQSTARLINTLSWNWLPKARWLGQHQHLHSLESDQTMFRTRQHDPWSGGVAKNAELERTLLHLTGSTARNLTAPFGASESALQRPAVTVDKFLSL